MSETSAPSKWETDQVFHCRTCASLRPEEGRLFCLWLGSFLERSALDGFCEGYKPKEPDAKQQGGKDKPVDNDEVSQAPRPKTDSASALKRPEKVMILTALELKKFKGSIVWEKVRCGKSNCRCGRGYLHGPFGYLHFYQAGRVRRRYLGKDLAVLVSKPREELEDRLRQIDGILGQGRPTVL